MKTSSLGDVVHHCPAVSEVARNFPGAEIDWVVEEAFAGVPAMHARVRRVVPVALRRWRAALFSARTWSELSAFRAGVGAERYDAVIDTQGLLKSVFLAKFAHGPLHGLDRASEREPLAHFFYRHVHAVPWALHPVERNRRLTAQALGYAMQGPPDYGLRAPAAAPRAQAVFLTMTSRAEKLWPEERWIALGRALGSRIVLPWGTQAEKARAQRIAAAIDGVVPESMSLAGLAELFVASSAVVGIDTGLTHFAAALGCRTVGIYCGTDPERYGLRAPRAASLGGTGRPPSADDVRARLS